MNLTADLIQLGLTKHEADVYMALLASGLCTSGPLIKKTGLHRMIVYNTLDSLVEKQYVQLLYQNNIKHFLATDPEIIAKKARQQQELADNLVPQLQLLQKGSAEKIETRILYGNKGFWNNLVDLIEAAKNSDDKIIRIIGGGSPESAYAIIGEFYDQYVRLLAKAKVAKHLITYSASQALWYKYFTKEKNTKMKQGPKTLKNNTFTRIAGDMVSIEIYSNPVVVIQIKNKEVAKSYRDNFQLLWESSGAFEKP